MKPPVPPLPQLGQVGLAVQPHVSQFNDLHLRNKYDCLSSTWMVLGTRCFELVGEEPSVCYQPSVSC